MGKLRLIEIIASEAHDDPIFFEKLEKIAIMQSILSPQGSVSTFQFSQLAKTAEWSSKWSEYSRLCTEVADRVNQLEGNPLVIPTTLMYDLSIISPVVARQYQIQKPILNAFLPKWTLATAVGTSLGGLAIQLPAKFLSNTIFIFVDFSTYQVIAGMVLGAIIGILIGFAQWLVIRRHIPMSIFWIISSGIGWSIGMAFSNTLFISKSEILIGVVVGLLQSLNLRRQIKPAWYWCCISIFAYYFSFSISESIGRELGEGVSYLGETIIGFFLGVLSGIPLIKFLDRTIPLPETSITTQQSSFNKLDSLKTKLNLLEDYQRMAKNIRENENCGVARLDDLFFLVPRDWEHRRVKTGHWEFMPTSIKYLFITVMFINAGGNDSTDDLMLEVEEKARERNWTFQARNIRKIDGKAEAIDVVTCAENGVAHRFVNFCYNGLEYFIDIKSLDLSEIKPAMPILDAWIDSFELRDRSFENGVS